MASPDTTPYSDLTIYDRDLQNLFDRAKNYTSSVLTDWVPSETNTEVVLMEALALMVSESIYSINRLPNTIAEILFKLYGITRSTGAYPTFTATFTVQGGHTSTVTIPQGFEVIYDLGDGQDIAVFSLDSAVDLAVGTNTATGTFTGNLKTARYNNIATGTAFTIISPLYFLQSVVTSTTISGGSGAESDDDYFDRASLRFARLSEALILPTHFSNYALEKTYVSTAKTVDLYNAPSGTAGSDYGHVALFVFGDNAYVSSANKTTLLGEIDDRCIASVTPTVNDPDNLAVVGVHTTVVRTSSSTSANTEVAVQNALTGYYHTTSWPWSKTLRWTNLVSLIENATGVDFIKDSGASIDLQFTLNKFDWNRYHVSSSDYATGTDTTWQATTNCSIAYNSDESYTDVGGSILVEPAGAGNVVIRSVDTTDAAAVQANAKTATAGNEYFISGRVKIPSSQTVRSVNVGVEWYTSAGATNGTAESTAVSTIGNTWVLLSDTVTAPASTAYAVLYFEIASAAASEDYYFDGFTISEFQDKNNDLTLTGEGVLVDLGETSITVEAP